MATTKKGYGQFCPVAKAAEIVAERWTPLILRELICGTHRFNDLRRGLPQMSPSLLSQRLKELEDAGIVSRTRLETGRGYTYALTEAGAELEPIIFGLGDWGTRWATSRLVKDDYDPALLMWDVHRRVDPTRVPGDTRTVVQFDLTGVPAAHRRWWLVFEEGGTDLCLREPAFDVDLFVASHIKALTHVWMGDKDLGAAMRSKEIRLEGPRPLVRSFPDWFSLSIFADANS